jgi:solute carrier family 25 S-adenosylmethionine transporter 26
MKREWTTHQGFAISPWQSALCGSSSGALAAAVTTPLDVCKTRLMLDMSGKYSTLVGTMKMIHAEEGWRALFSGVQPRVFWISLGGLVFFGAYEEGKRRMLSPKPASF